MEAVITRTGSPGAFAGVADAVGGYG